MAETVFKRETIVLEDYETNDEIELTLRPLPIARQRKFAEVIAELRTVDQEDPEKEEKEVNIFLKAAAVAIEPIVAKYIKKEDSTEQAKLFNARGEIGKEYKVWLESYLDEDSLFRILKVCGGIDMETPKALMEEARQKAMKESLDEA